MCVSDNDNAYHMYAGARAVHMGPFGEIRTKKTAPRGSIKDKKDRASWSETVHMGPFREIRMKKTAPRGSIKDKKDRASWSESGPYGSP